MKKIGILGGTFNPIHHGHLILGQTALEDFGLDKVLIIPTKNPAYKKISKNVEIEDRVNMVKLAIASHPGFEFSDIELYREGYTYTVDTLRKLTQMHPDAEYYFIMGADSLYQIESWKDTEQILSMATILVASRNDSRSALDAQIEYIQDKYQCSICHLDSPDLEISSNEIRKRAARGQSIRYFVPEEVRLYIERNDLYGTE